MIIETKHIPTGIGLPVLRLLCLLEERRECLVGEVSTGLAVSPANTSGIVCRAESAHLVCRRPAPGDARKCYVRLTPKGQALVESLRPPVLS